MNFLRLHWFDFGIVVGILASGYVRLEQFTELELVLWLNLIALFLHQFEEYRYPGYFPGMLNTVMFHSKQPDRYPLNTNTSLIVNVALGWTVYLVAALFGAQALWLAIAVMLVSLGNVLAHTFLFNLKGKTLYNPGMLTALLLFAPLVVYFAYLVIQGNLASPPDWVVGIALGIALNYLGVFKMIDWLKDEKTPYIFPKRCLPPEGKM